MLFALLGFTSPMIDLGALIRARLDLARPVALAKLYSRAPIEDPARERQVILAVRRQAVALGVPPDRAATFFLAQIEASKAAQRAWQNQWRITGAPFEAKPDLARQVRPKLDALTPQLIRALRQPSADPNRYRPAEPFLRGAWRIAITPVRTARSAPQR